MFNLYSMFVCDLNGPLKPGDVLGMGKFPHAMIKHGLKRSMRSVPSFMTNTGWRVIVSAEFVWFASKSMQMANVYAVTEVEFITLCSKGFINQCSPQWVQAYILLQQTRMQERWEEDAISITDGELQL